MAWTTTELLAAVRRRTQVPDGGPRDDEILSMASEEIGSRFVGLVRSTRENYLVTSADVPIVAGEARYRLPRRAHGSALRDLWVLDTAGRARQLLHLSLTDGHAFVGELGAPQAFYLEGERVVLCPTPAANTGSVTLRMTYYRRPSALVAVSACMQIASFDAPPNLNPVLLGTTPTAWTGALSVDIVQAQPPFDLLGAGVAATASIPGVLANLDVDSIEWDILEVGDYVCLAGETCVPQIPDALWPALVSATAVQLLLEEADRAGAQAESTQRDQLIQAALESIQPRVDGRAKPIINVGSILRRGGRRR